MTVQLLGGGTVTRLQRLIIDGALYLLAEGVILPTTHVDICRLLLLSLLLEVLEGGLDLQTLLQIEEGGVLQTTVADKVVKLVSSLDNVKIEDVVESDDVLLLEDANVAIDVQVLQVLLPHVEADDLDNLAQDLLQ